VAAWGSLQRLATSVVGLMSAAEDASGFDFFPMPWLVAYLLLRETGSCYPLRSMLQEVDQLCSLSPLTSELDSDATLEAARHHPRTFSHLLLSDSLRLVQL
jgi:hypothetical protein